MMAPPELSSNAMITLCRSLPERSEGSPLKWRDTCVTSVLNPGPHDFLNRNLISRALYQTKPRGLTQAK